LTSITRDRRDATRILLDEAEDNFRVLEAWVLVDEASQSDETIVEGA